MLDRLLVWQSRTQNQIADHTDLSLFLDKKETLVDRDSRQSFNLSDEGKPDLRARRRPTSRIFFGESLSKREPLFCSSTVVRGSGFLARHISHSSINGHTHTISWYSSS